MTEIVFGGVSPRSLGDLLKGYGVMAIVGEHWPETLFWWDERYRLAASVPVEADGKADSEHGARLPIRRLCASRLTPWAEGVGEAFQPVRRSRRDAREPEKTSLATAAKHDFFAPDVSRFARAVALPLEEAGQRLEQHPLFPAFGQEASGNYFSQLMKAVVAAKKAPDDLDWSLFADGPPNLKARLTSGYLFFPEPMKRYATGIEKWIRENDAPRSAWCFLLAMRGAMLLRGSLRRLRWGRRSYPAFPFVFEGSAVATGKTISPTREVHLPTWKREHARTLEEFELQARQFHARLRAGSFAATAAEFRAAIVGRATGVAFDTFHRFVLEPRRPGRDRPMPQAIPRGLTRAARSGVADLRLMLAPLAEAGWIDQFGASEELRLARRRFDEAVHRAVDQPRPEQYIGILQALWQLNQELLLSGRIARLMRDAKRNPPIPAPSLPTRPWEEALAPLMNGAEYRLARAIGSIQGSPGSGGGVGIGPLLEHLLPVRWEGGRWVPPKEERYRPYRWSGRRPEHDFGVLLWRRWLDAEGLEVLPFGGRRNAPLEDVIALLRGEIDLGEVYKLVPSFALLDWASAGEQPDGGASDNQPAAVPPAYAALRLWLESGIHPPAGARPPRDGSVARLLSLGGRSQVERAVERALARLRISGLPWPDEPWPSGKAVARFSPALSDAEASRMAAAVLIPIARRDTIKLSRRLWVASD